MSGAAELWRSGGPIGPLRELLDRGGVLGVPTESSYALAADPASSAGVAAVFRAKGRPAGKPLPVVAADVEQLRRLGVELKVAEDGGWTRLWPGALTLVLPLAGPLPAAAGATGLAVRVPGHAGLRRLLDRLGRPLTATSANRSGEAPLLDPRQVARLVAGIDARVVDGGRAPGGPPSTLVDLTGRAPTVLRCGRMPLDRLPGGGGFSAAGVEISADRRR